MSKVKRGRAPKKGSRRTTDRRSAAARTPRRLRNWVEARVRGARYRAANALRLIAAACAGLAVIAIASLALLGRLDDVGRAATDTVNARLASIGFAVESVDVTGAEEADAIRIAEAAALYAGQPIFAVDPRDVRARIEALPDVRSATVARLWPNRIAVVVDVREPYALWQMDGALHVIDRDGVVMAEADIYDPPALPLVVDEGANLAVTEIVEALGAHPQIAEQTVGAVRVGARRWNLRLENGVDVKLPEGEPLAAIALLAALHEERGVLHLTAESFDLRGEGDLVVRARADRAAHMEMKGREA